MAVLLVLPLAELVVEICRGCLERLSVVVADSNAAPTMEVVLDLVDLVARFARAIDLTLTTSHLLLLLQAAVTGVVRLEILEALLSALACQTVMQS
mmetsp:Transcript_26010/g.34813  ORF Transcript_26010/g.34813 Transcript_26010/m.34813 type:complete len:96 (-) Transcript_26010:268-555(-)